MPVVGIRELGRNASAIIRELRKTKKPTLITDRGQPVGLIYSVDADALEDFILANAPEFVEGMRRADEELATGQTHSLESVLEEIRREELEG